VRKRSLVQPLMAPLCLSPSTASSVLLRIFFKINISPEKDLTPLIETARNSLVLVGNPKLGPKTLPELISYVKARPGQINVASPSAGTLFHVAALLFNDLAGLDMRHVPYKGSAQAQSDVIGGHIPLLFDALPGAAENILAGNIHAYAVNGGAGQSDALGIPTFGTLGYPDMEMLAPWILFAGPPGMSSSLAKQIHDSISEVIRSEEYIQRMKQLRSGPPKTTSIEDLRESLRSEVERVAIFLKSKNIQPE
jgi:tripartite-type tricarboxylate transporter receptor subunit TctC